MVQLLDRCKYTGPNGKHSCIVLKLLGPRLAVEAQCYQANRLPGYIAWEVCHEVALAVEYFHANGIVHGGWLEQRLVLPYC